MSCAAEEARPLSPCAVRCSPHPPLPLPTMYVQNETHALPGHGSSNQLRFRNRSNDSGPNSSSSTFVPSTPLSPEPTALFHSPLYASPDSGIMDSSYAYSPTGSSATVLKPVFVHAKLSDSAAAVGASPLEELRRRWRRRTALFDTEPSLHLQQYLPFLVIIVILASSAFTILTLNSLVGRDGGLWRSSDPAEVDKLIRAAAESNGKYASIEFGARTRVKRLAEEGRMSLEEATKDDKGAQLGGKKAAMQYAHRMRDAIQTDDKGDVNVKEISELKVEYDSLAEKEDPQEDAEEIREQRKRLRKKLSQFGTFTTSQLKPLDLNDIKPKKDRVGDDERPDVEAEEEVKERLKEVPDKKAKTVEKVSNKTSTEKEEAPKREVTEPKQKKKRSPRIGDGQTRRSNPFRKHGGGRSGESRDREGVVADSEDDPFRFV